MVIPLPQRSFLIFAAAQAILLRPFWEIPVVSALRSTTDCYSFLCPSRSSTATPEEAAGLSPTERALARLEERCRPARPWFLSSSPGASTCGIGQSPSEEDSSDGEASSDGDCSRSPRRSNAAVWDPATLPPVASNAFEEILDIRSEPWTLVERLIAENNNPTVSLFRLEQVRNERNSAIWNRIKNELEETHEVRWLWHGTSGVDPKAESFKEGLRPGKGASGVGVYLGAAYLFGLLYNGRSFF